MKRRYIDIPFAVVCVFILVSEGLAQSAGQAGGFLRIGLGPRARAMGDAYSAVPEHAVIPYYNPAGLGFLRNREASISGAVMSFDRRFNFAGFVSPLPPSAGYGISIIQSGFGGQDARGSNGEPTGQTVDDFQYAVLMGFAIRFTDKFAAGITPTWLYSKVFDVSSTSLGVGLGATYSPMENVYASYSIHHLFQDFNYVRNPSGLGDETTKDKLPRVTRYGVSYMKPMSGTIHGVLLSVDAEHVERQGMKLHFGSEINVLKRALVRFGSDNGDLTLGLGLPFKWKDRQFFFDYAFVRDVRSGIGMGSQDFSISMRL